MKHVFYEDFNNINRLCSVCFSYCNLWCGSEVPGMILLHSYLYTYNLLWGLTFEALPLSSYALSPKMLPQLETFLEHLLWNSFRVPSSYFFDVFNILKSSSL